jgi:hypothetical protein
LLFLLPSGETSFSRDRNFGFPTDSFLNIIWLCTLNTLVFCQLGSGT